MGIKLAIAGGLLLVVLSGALYAKFRIGRLEKQIVQLQEEKIKLDNKNKAQEATINYLQKHKTVKTRIIREKSEISKTVESGDLGRIRALYRKYRVRPEAGGGDAGDGRGGGSSDRPATTSGAG